MVGGAAFGAELRPAARGAQAPRYGRVRLKRTFVSRQEPGVNIKSAFSAVFRPAARGAQAPRYGRVRLKRTFVSRQEPGVNIKSAFSRRARSVAVHCLALLGENNTNNGIRTICDFPARSL